MNIRIIRLAWLIVALPSFGSQSVTAQEVSVAKRVKQIVAKIESGSAKQIWTGVADLEQLGSIALADIALALKQGPQAGLGAAKALLVMENGDIYRAQALKTLKALVLNQELPRELRLMATELYMSQGGKSDLRALRKVIKGIEDPYVQITAFKGMRSYGRRFLKEFLKSDDQNLRAEAALALAESGNVTTAKDVLDLLKTEPTERGRRARLLLERERMLSRLEQYGGLSKRDDIVKMQKTTIARLEVELKKARELARKGGDSKKTMTKTSRFPLALGLLEELLGKIQAYYVEAEKIEEGELADLAAQGLLEGLDPFSSYMNEQDTKKFTENIRQSYAGIGAVVQIDPRTGYLTIVRPIYNGPAYRTGLRTLDQVLTVEGVSTKGKTVQDLVGVLKGKRGTKVKIQVQHFLGDQTPQSIEITRDFISLPSVSYELLPGSIGYLQLSQFGFKAVEEVKRALDDLVQRGMVGLVFDLRGNPGGLLSAAVGISELFLKKDRLIVYQQGRKGNLVGRRKEFRTKFDSPYPSFPMTIMIDQASASASEIVSGALKVHKRAVLVGQRTFGKGSVQQLFPVRTTQGKSRLRLTVAYYYLPDGTLIHRQRSPRAWRFRELLARELRLWQQNGLINTKQADRLRQIYKPTPGGVAPDHYVERESLTPDDIIKLAEIRRSLEVEKYVQTHYLENRKLFAKLVVDDREDLKAYPDVQTLIAKLKKVDPDITPELIRSYLRETLRRFVQDDLRRQLPSDFQGDRQMERALYEILKRAGVDTSKVKEYELLIKRGQQADAAKKQQAEKARKSNKKDKDSHQSEGEF